MYMYIYVVYALSVNVQHTNKFRTASVAISLLPASVVKYIYVCICTYICICIYIDLRVYMYVYIGICIYTCVSTPCLPMSDIPV